MKRDIPVFLLAVAVVAQLAGCVKIPQKPISPAYKVDVVNNGGAESFVFKISAGFQNENHDVALTDVKGFLRIVDGGRTVLSVPYTLKAVLPLELGVIDIEQKIAEKDLKPVLDMQKIDLAEVRKNRGTEGIYLDEKNIVLETTSYTRRGILDLLRERAAKKDAVVLEKKKAAEQQKDATHEKR